MAYCRKCGHEYADSVKRCIECGTVLRAGHRPTTRYNPTDAMDVLVPLGLFVCLLASASLLYLSLASRFGWIVGPLPDLIRNTQPPCFVTLYLVGAIASAAMLAFWLLRLLTRHL